MDGLLRDKDKFHRRFPALRLERRRYLPWLSYLLSGGVNLRSFVPGPLTLGDAASSIGFSSRSIAFLPYTGT